MAAKKGRENGKNLCRAQFQRQRSMCTHCTRKIEDGGGVQSVKRNRKNAGEKNS